MNDKVTINLRDIQREIMLADDPKPILEKYFVSDEQFSPSLELADMYEWDDPEEVARSVSSLIRWANSICSAKRYRKYLRSRRDYPNRPVIISEGDSWFLHPLIRDTIDHIAKELSVRSLGAAGDEIWEMVEQDQIQGALIEIPEARALLVSGGGNDILGDTFPNFINEYQTGMGVDELISDQFPGALNTIISHYETIIEWVNEIRPGMRILVHSYDYVLPVAGGKFLGKHLKNKGITDTQLQKDLLQEFINRFHARLEDLAQHETQIAVVSHLGSVAADQWADEIHPDKHGYATVAGNFRAVLGF
ncbi:MAG: hypothetical protein MI746_05270 [Pseudomonadales bacterium]|nr:hypothetical protein [Pseudomonadales bacterium]